VKQIPDPDSAPDPQLGTSWVVEDRVAMLDDADRCGVELGLQLAGDDREVTLVSLGSGGGQDGIRQGLAMGAEKAVLVQPDPAVGADLLTTARALSEVIAAEGFDLVITGAASADGSAGVMCQMLGELLDAPAIAGVTSADVSGGTLTVHRQTSGGYDVITCPLPAVISVTAGAVDPRFPTIRGSMKAKRKQIDRREIAAVLPDWADAAERMPRVASTEPLPAKVAGRTIEDDGTAHLAVVALLEEQGLI